MELNLFQNADDVLDWCEKYRVYAIIGLHLFTDEEPMERMYILMEEADQRYKDRKIVSLIELHSPMR